MKFKKTLHAPLFGFLLILSFFVSVYGKSHSKVTFLGVSSSTLPARMSEQLNLPPNIYLSVDQVSPGSPASEAGLEIYDVILQLNDQLLVNSPQLKALVRMKKPGDNVDLKILRKGNHRLCKLPFLKLTNLSKKESLILDLKVLALCQVIFFHKILICSPQT